MMPHAPVEWSPYHRQLAVGVAYVVPAWLSGARTAPKLDVAFVVKNFGPIGHHHDTPRLKPRMHCNTGARHTHTRAETSKKRRGAKERRHEALFLRWVSR